MSLLIVFALNVAVFVFLWFAGDDKNIESRTDREEEILKKKK
jgi:hypothetical protein